MKPTITALIVATLASVGSGVAADRPREVNITTDSAPGWLPSEEQEGAAVQVVRKYFDLLDHGDTTRAYAMMTDIQRQHLPFEEWAKSETEFRSKAGPLQNVNLLKVTWTKDPAAAPVPGIYVAIDVSARFANIDRHCGYIVLYQATADDAFGIMRTESTTMTNADAAKSSPEETDRAWARVAAWCPNYDPRSARTH